MWIKYATIKWFPWTWLTLWPYGVSIGVLNNLNVYSWIAFYGDFEFLTIGWRWAVLCVLWCVVASLGIHCPVTVYYHASIKLSKRPILVKKQLIGFILKRLKMWNVGNGSVVPPQFASVAFEFILYLMIKVIQSAYGGEWFMN